MILLPGFYAPSLWTKDTPLQQGEILSNVIELRLSIETLEGTNELQFVERIHPLAIVLTQDCDLEQDFSARHGQRADDKLLPSLLFCEVAKANDLFSRLKSQQAGAGSKLWDRIRINKDERFHFLQKVDPQDDVQGHGLDEMGIDFKRYFTLPTDEVYHRIRSGQTRRHCYLLSPYMEHLCSRFAYFLSRVALPEEHFSER